MQERCKTRSGIHERTILLRFLDIIVRVLRLEVSLLNSLTIHCKKELAVFPSPAGMSLIKLFLGGNFPGQGEFGQ
jgi:hypothetical protein